MTVPGTRLDFAITFHGPFRSATGHADLGRDVTVDREVPISGSHLKGIMRDAARDMLSEQHPLISEVFGTPRSPSPWSWADAEFPDGIEVADRSRVAIDPETHTADDRALFTAQEVWAVNGTFSIRRQAWLEPDRVAEHTRLLTLAALGVHHLGGDRRRGFGWVTVERTDDQRPELDELLDMT